MKKLVMFSLIALTIQSFGQTNKKEVEHDCSQMRNHYLIYEDTIQRVFLGVDSTMFHVYDKSYLMNIEDSLSWIVYDDIEKVDLVDYRTGHVFRVWYSYSKVNLRSVYDPQFYGTWR